MKPTILAVDDDPIICDVYKFMLGDVYDIYLASSGEEALDSLRFCRRPDLILLDIKMPGIDGYEVCENIRNNVDFSNIKIILVSGESSIEDRVKGYKVGADDYIIKPFEADELLAKIKVFLRLKNVEELDRMKETFLSLTSHETRTSLNGIIGYAQLLQENGNIPEEDREFLEAILSCGYSLLKLIEKIFLLNDLRSNNIEIYKNKININDIITASKIKLEEKANKKEILFRIQHDMGIEVDGDSKLLTLAFEIVFDNAVKFAHQGTVVEVTLNEVGKHIQVNIANEGEKIIEEDRENIFTAFFVQDIKHHHRGHGLGLEIARRIVTVHEGTLSVRNLERGPMFLFELPSACPGPLTT